MSENATAKAHRLLGEGRLTVQAVDGDRIVASCRGDSGRVYTLGFDEESARWRCSCEARGDNCSHLQALRLVVIRT